MKILRIINSLNPIGGGPVESVKKSSKYHVESSHPTEVLCCDPIEADYLKADDCGHLTIHALGKCKTGWCYNRKLIPWLRANHTNYDVILVHGMWLFHSYATWTVLRNTETPWYLFPHGMLDPWFQRMSNRPVKAIRNKLYWKLIEHRIVRDATGVLFTCEQERILARKPFRPYSPKEIVVPYGTSEPPTFHETMRTTFEQRCPDLRTRPYLLFLSRIHPKKGTDLLIKAYSMIIKSGSIQLPDLVIAGPGLETTYGQQCLKLAKKFQSDFNGTQAPKIHFPGMLQEDAKWGAFYGCEAFILPSHQENFGIVVAESLACGKPVLISDQVNIFQEIRRAKAGFIAKDTLEGTKSLLSFWSKITQGERRKMSATAKMCFNEQFRIENAASNLLRAISPPTS